MNIHYWPAIPLAALTAIVVAYVLYTEERQRVANPVEPWFDKEDAFIAHLPHPWSTTPPGWNRHP